MRTRVRTLATYLAARLLPAAATMCLTFVCIDALRAEDYAHYSVVMLAVGFAAGFAGGVSGQPMLRYARELSPAALRTGLFGLPLLAAVLAAGGVLAYLGAHVGWSAPTWLAAGAIPGLALIDTRRSLFIARGFAGRVLALDGCRSAAALLIGVILMRAVGPAGSATAAEPMLAQLLSVALCLLLVRARPAAALASGTRAIDARYVGFGIGLAGWAALIVGLSLAERAVLAATVGTAASGGYAAQADVVNAVFAAAGGALAATMMPAYLRQAAAPDALALRRLLGLGSLGVAGIVLLCLVLGAALTLLPGWRFAQALTADAGTGLALVAAAAVWTAAGFVQKPVELRGQTRQLVAGVVAALLIFVAIAPAMAAWAGPLGVALAKLLAGLAYAAMAFAMARHRGGR